MDWSPDGQDLAYSQGDGIWIAQSPAYMPELLVNIPEGRMGAVYWSPDGRYLAFSGDCPWKGSLAQFIWVIRSDGTELRTLPVDEMLGPYRLQTINQWLDTRTLAVDLWVGTGAQAHCRVDVISGESTPLVGAENSTISIQAQGGEYSWSPTLEYIVIDYLGYGHLVLVDVAQGSEHWFSTMEDWPGESFHGWSRDGQRFLYSKWDEKEGQYDLWLWDVMQQKSEKLLPRVYQAALSPDGIQVAFLRQEDCLGQVPTKVAEKVFPEQWPPALTAGMLEVNAGTTILYGPAGYRADEGPVFWKGGQPVWSPDGELVAYWGEDSDIWVTSADGAWQQRLTWGMEIIQVLWSPDGTKLALRTFDQAWIIARPGQE